MIEVGVPDSGPREVEVAATRELPQRGHIEKNVVGAKSFRGHSECRTECLDQRVIAGLDPGKRRNGGKLGGEIKTGEMRP